jgi:hypothetical protein
MNFAMYIDGEYLKHNPTLDVDHIYRLIQKHGSNRELSARWGAVLEKSFTSYSNGCPRHARLLAMKYLHRYIIYACSVRKSGCVSS